MSKASLVLTTPENPPLSGHWMNCIYTVFSHTILISPNLQKHTMQNISGSHKISSLNYICKSSDFLWFENMYYIDLARILCLLCIRLDRWSCPGFSNLAVKNDHILLGTFQALLYKSFGRSCDNLMSLANKYCIYAFYLFSVTFPLVMLASMEGHKETS